MESESICQHLSHYLEALPSGTLDQCKSYVLSDELKCTVPVTYTLQPNGLIYTCQVIKDDPHAAEADSLNKRHRFDISNRTIVNDWLFFSGRSATACERASAMTRLIPLRASS